MLNLKTRTNHVDGGLCGQWTAEGDARRRFVCCFATQQLSVNATVSLTSCVRSFVKNSFILKY